MASISQLTNFSSAVRWFRRNLTGPGLIDGLKTAVWVVPLTILIWVYAEQQQTTIETNQTILIDVPHLTSDGNRVVTVVGKDDVLTAELRGSKAHLDSVKGELNKPGETRLVRIDVPPDLPDGLNNLNIGPQVQRAGVFSDNGVAVSNVRPDTIRVLIDTLETRELEVKAAANPNLLNAPVFDPPKVRVRAPKSYFADPKNLVATVQIPTIGEAARPGSHEPVALPVELPVKSENTTFSPTTVLTSYQIKQSDREYQIDSITVRRSFSAHMEDEYTVTAEDVVRDVRVLGPPDEIAKIEKGEVIPEATLRIDSSDKSKTTGGSKHLEFDTKQPHVTVLQQDAQKLFDYAVHKRTS